MFTLADSAFAAQALLPFCLLLVARDAPSQDYCYILIHIYTFITNQRLVFSLKKTARFQV